METAFRVCAAGELHPTCALEGGARGAREGGHIQEGSGGGMQEAVSVCCAYLIVYDQDFGAGSLRDADEQIH